jgi:hypothetical protein
LGYHLGSVPADNASAWSLASSPQVQPARDTPAVLISAAPRSNHSEAHVGEIVLQVDDFDPESFTNVTAQFGQDRYGFVVTPNIDHLNRHNEDTAFRAHYRTADYVLMDSRVAAVLVPLLKGEIARVYRLGSHASLCSPTW